MYQTRNLSVRASDEFMNAAIEDQGFLDERMSATQELRKEEG